MYIDCGKTSEGIMKTWINLYVDVSDLEIDYTATRESEMTEMWGREETEFYWDVDIHSVKYNGVETDDFDEAAVIDFIINHRIGLGNDDSL